MYDPAIVATKVTNPKERVIVSVDGKAVTKSAGLISASDGVTLLLMLGKIAPETRRGTLLLGNTFGRPRCAIGVSYVAQCNVGQGGCDGQIG